MGHASAPNAILKVDMGTYKTQIVGGKLDEDDDSTYIKASVLIAHAHAPPHTVFCVDDSGSMYLEHNEITRKERVNLFLDLWYKNEEAHRLPTAIVKFACKSEVTKPFDKEYDSEFHRNTDVGATTYPGPALAEAAHILKQSGEDESPKIVVLLSDGEFSAIEDECALGFLEQPNTYLFAVVIGEAEELESASKACRELISCASNKTPPLRVQDMEETSGALARLFQYIEQICCMHLTITITIVNPTAGVTYELDTPGIPTSSSPKWDDKTSSWTFTVDSPVIETVKKNVTMRVRPAPPKVNVSVEPSGYCASIPQEIYGDQHTTWTESLRMEYTRGEVLDTITQAPDANVKQLIEKLEAAIPNDCQNHKSCPKECERVHSLVNDLRSSENGIGHDDVWMDHRHQRNVVNSDIYGTGKQARIVEKVNDLVTRTRNMVLKQPPASASVTEEDRRRNVDAKRDIADELRGMPDLSPSAVNEKCRERRHSLQQQQQLKSYPGLNETAKPGESEDHISVDRDLSSSEDKQVEACKTAAASTSEEEEEHPRAPSPTRSQVCQSSAGSIERDSNNQDSTTCPAPEWMTHKLKTTGLLPRMLNEESSVATTSEVRQDENVETTPPPPHKPVNRVEDTGGPPTPPPEAILEWQGSLRHRPTPSPPLTTTPEGGERGRGGGDGTCRSSPTIICVR